MVSVRPVDDPARVQARPRLLARRERRVVEAFAEAVVGAPRTDDGGGVSATVDRFELWLAGEPRPVQRGLRALCWLLDAVALARTGRPLEALPVDRRTALLRDLLAGSSQPLRAAVRALLAPVRAAHVDHARMHATVGVPYGLEPPVSVERPAWWSNVLDGDRLTEPTSLECDVVVVGSGAAGAAAAHALAARGLGVVIVEQGRWFDRRHFDGHPIDRMREMFLERGMTIALGNLGIPVWAGCTVGGTTTVNSGTCYRTPDGVLREWVERLGLRGLRPEAMEPYFERVERALQVAEADRRYLGTIASIIARGADRLGLSHGPLRRNAPDCDGQGLCCFGCPTGAKRSADIAWLPGALQRGATLLTRTRVERIVVDASGPRATGVDGRSAAGGRVRIEARATLVAGGALLTPLLLARSGLRNRWIGRNLSVHPAGSAFALFDEPVDMHRGIPQGYAVDALAHEGIVFEGASLPLVPTATGLPVIGARYAELVARYRNLALFGFMIRDQSRGRVLPRPGDGGPLILYDMNEADAARMRRGMLLLCELFLEAGARAVWPGISAAPELRHRGDLEALRRERLPAGRFEVTAYHPLGTARMAADPALGVVGPDHETHEVRDLYVVCGAAVPSALGVNPQVTIMALALRAADVVGRRLERRGLA
ncbi:MAG: FAD-dependent oxidoreductase [Myxococcales bacterium]|nr:FAD-dependent oxidoreductase [Myxococcales bacterium]